MVQNLEEGRRSGLLVPRFTLTDIVRNSPGYTRQISDLGWYWAVNDYLGAQVNYVAMQDAYDTIYGIVDLHALTTVHDGAELARLTREVHAALNAPEVAPSERSLCAASLARAMSASPWSLSRPAFRQSTLWRAAKVETFAS